MSNEPPEKPDLRLPARDHIRVVPTKVPWYNNAEMMGGFFATVFFGIVSLLLTGLVFIFLVWLGEKVV